MLCIYFLHERTPYHRKNLDQFLDDDLTFKRNLILTNKFFRDGYKSIFTSSEIHTKGMKKVQTQTPTYVTGFNKKNLYLSLDTSYAL